ncbi:hypothetical protein M2360_000913 [Rhizobium sp. SG_E_25_P2]|uniref:hypothetical protein n=1 Tax=Rhizobium sp. SG_E_25_P2 TaxID=2879942 RepID=UPI0024761034|nr:hypothetical protein [Rhizobium sp. SG_E_25_P2]MDH6265523.1 hypothetical protein [Rhizobium sp. SG_E_25_P2]
MSQVRFSVIPAWVVTDPRLKGRDLQVLCLLGRHTDRGGWCRRSQVKMAGEMGVARSTVQASLDRLYGLGVVEKHQQQSADGRDSAHWYRVILDQPPPAGFAFAAWLNEDGENDISETEDVAENAGSTPADISAGGAGPELAPPAGSGPAPINVPSLTPPDQRKEREGASARSGGARAETAVDDEGDDEARLLRRVKAMEVGRGGGQAWPGCIGSSTSWAAGHFAKLTPEERRTAEERRDAYLALCAAQKVKPVALGVYFRDRKWEGVADATIAARAASRIKAAPFGPVWAGMKALALAAGPKRIELPDDVQREVTAAYEAFASRSATTASRYLISKGLRVEGGRLVFPADFREREIARRVTSQGYPEVNHLHDEAGKREAVVCEARFAGLKDLCEPVPVGSALYEAWRAEHERRGWPWHPDPGGMRVVYFPKGGPEGFDAWSEAAKSAVDGGEGC